jgi:oxygen-independent coproporphyrinogen-3 oxidase
MARQAGFDNIGIDLIHSLPGQTADHWQTELQKAISLAPEHISAYGLTLEEGTPLNILVDQGALHPPLEEEAAAIYSLTGSYLAAAGYEQYEISNFARPGRESRHNLTYWRWAPYLGFGAGAHSFLPVPFPGERWSNHPDPDDFVTAISTENLPETAHSALTIREATAEWLFLGLRTNTGIDPEQFFDYFGFPVETACDGAIADLIDKEQLIHSAGRIRLPDSAFVLSNQIFVRLI